MDTLSPVLYIDLTLPAGDELQFPALPGNQLGVYCLTPGGLSVRDQSLAFGELLAWGGDSASSLRAGTEKPGEDDGASRLIILGGVPFPERRSLD